ncbi:MAG: MATE family efflux transporter [Lachnospiraceae bacterium]|nr:MATE family efflux transporter [Lachnospiraceae bacterium]
MRNSKTAPMDMLHGPMLKNILVFALPLALGSILQQLFNAVDVAIVGRFASSEAMAAVGANSTVTLLLINLFVGLSVGSNVVIAQHIGREEYDKVGDAVHTSILLAIVGGVCLLVIGLIIARPLLSLMSTPDNILDMAVLYLRIYCIGMPFIMLYNFAAAILRSIGDTRRPLYCLLTGGVINAVLNIFFVIVLHMDVDGVAIATVISNVVSAFMALFFLMRSDELVRPHFRKLRFHRKEVGQILKIGVPAGVQSAVFCIANVVIQSSINTFGSNAIAGGTVASNFEYISYNLVNGFNAAVMTFVGQNLGAGDKKRCARAIALGMVSALVCTIALNTGIYLARDWVVGLFTKDAAVAKYAIERLRWVLLLHFMICSYEITGAAMRGLGKSLTPALLAIFGTCLFRIVYVGTVVVHFHVYKVLMWVYPFSWILTGAMTVIAFMIVWRHFKIDKTELT